MLGGLLRLIGLIVVVVGGLAIYLAVSGVDVVVRNERCETFKLGSALPPGVSQIVGFLSVPSEIATNSQETMRWPEHIPVTGDLTRGRSVRLTVFGAPIDFDLPDNVNEVRLNGEVVSGQVVEWDPAERESHELVLSCPEPS